MANKIESLRASHNWLTEAYAPLTYIINILTTYIKMFFPPRCNPLTESSSFEDQCEADLRFCRELYTIYWKKTHIFTGKEAVSNFSNDIAIGCSSPIFHSNTACDLHQRDEEITFVRWTCRKSDWYIILSSRCK